MSLPLDQQTSVLLHLHEYQTKEIQRRETREQQLFEWTVSLLLAAFGAVIALSDRDSPLPYPVSIKWLATFLIGVPVLIFVRRIGGYSKRALENAEVVGGIEELLKLFDPGVYGDKSPYPVDWKDFSQKRESRTTHYYYSLIMVVMAGCVIATVWLIL